jgi:arginyl-tRNA synthetase
MILSNLYIKVKIINNIIMYKYLEQLFLPIFENLCQKYNVVCNRKIDLISKSRFADYQFCGIAIISNQLNGNIQLFINDLLRELNNNRICNCTANRLFINITIQKQFISQIINNINIINNTNENKQKTVLIDYSSPNIAKELHVGHLRSTIIGDSLSNLYEYFGHKVHRINHIGDWGGQFGMVIAYAKKYDLDHKLLDNEISITQLMEIYQKAKELSKNDEDFKNETKKYVLKLQSGDAKCIELWKIICQMSRNDYEKIYNMLNIKPIEETGESFYNQYIPSVLDDLKEKNILEDSNGALILKTKHHPLIMVKSDKGYTYDTTDLTALWYRTQCLKANEIIYLTDSGQRTHFEGLFEIADKLGWLKNCTCKHLGFGLVMKDGKKISSRNQNNKQEQEQQEQDINQIENNDDEKSSLKLKELLFDAIDKAKEIWMKKEENTDDNDVKKKYLETRNELGYIDMAINSIKYFDFSHHYQSNYNFDKNKMIQFDGNTATYVLYRYAQINNILKQKQPNVNVNYDYGLDIEKTLALKIFELEHTLEFALKSHQLNTIVSYIFELSQNFSTLWNYKDKQGLIIGSPYEQSRLLLCQELKKVYDIVFGILGLKLLDSV